MEIDGGFAAARDAEEERRGAVAEHFVQAVIGGLLRSRERRDGDDLRGRFDRAAEGRLAVLLDKLFFDELIQALAGRAGEIAELAARRAADAAEQIEKRRLLRRAAAQLLRLLQRLLHGNGKGGKLGFAVVDAALFRPLHAQNPRLDQRAQRRGGVFLSKRALQIRQLRRAVMGVHGFKRAALALRIQRRERGGKVHALRETVDRADTVPHAGGQNGLDGVVHRAEKAVSHPERETQELTREQRLRIEQLQDRFELRRFRLLRQRKHDALHGAVAAAKGHQDPAPRLHRHFGRDAIGVGPVKGEGRGRDRDAGHRKAHDHSLTISSLPE